MKDLDKNELRELTDDLDRLVGELEAALGAATEGAKPVGLDQPIGRISRMDAIQQQSMAQANRDSVRARLQQAKAAIARLARDEYGTCMECEEPIAFARLKARPEAAFCVSCQGRLELV